MRIWRTIFDKHCSDAALLAYADGELARPRRWTARWHLEMCWQCRARLFALEKATRKAAEAAASSTYPGIGRKAGARQRLVEAMAETERAAIHVPRFSITPARRLRAAKLLAAAAAAAVALIFGAPKLLEPKLPSAEAVLSRAAAFERDLSAQPLEQEIRFAASEEDAPQEPAGRLRAWSDGASGRFAARWENSGGALEQALWREPEQGVFLFDRSADTHVVRRLENLPPVGLVETLARSELSAAQLERAFVRWIMSRKWRPLGIAAGVAEFAARDGVSLRIERLAPRPDVPSTALYRLTAESPAGKRRVILWLDVTRTEFRPVRLAISIEEDGRRVTLHVEKGRPKLLTAQNAREQFQPAWIRRAVFEPGLAWPAARRSRRSPPAPASSAVRSRQADPLTAELELRYALHRAGACLRDTVEITRAADGRLAVTGVVESEARRRELAALLTEIAGPALARIGLRTLEETAAASNAPPLSALVEEQRVTVAGEGIPPLIALLYDWKRSRGVPAQAAMESATAAANSAVEQAGDMLMDAAALDRLRKALAGRNLDGAARQSLWLLEVMVGDHVRSLESHLARFRSLAGEPLAEAAGIAATAAPAPAATAASWAETVEILGGCVGRLHDLTLRGFAGGETAAATPAELLAAIERTAASLAGARRRLARRQTESPGGNRQ